MLSLLRRSHFITSWTYLASFILFLIGEHLYIHYREIGTWGLNKLFGSTVQNWIYGLELGPSTTLLTTLLILILIPASVMFAHLIWGSILKKNNAGRLVLTAITLVFGWTVVISAASYFQHLFLYHLYVPDPNFDFTFSNMFYNVHFHVLPPLVAELARQLIYRRKLRYDRPPELPPNY